MKIARALISVTNKTGVAGFARGLQSMGVQILSTGGTARALREAGVEVTALEAFTGAPEMLDGRVKTLHPKVHGGILFRRDSTAHEEERKTHGIEPIDLVVVNLYDFEGATRRSGATFHDVVEEIDIGGPTLLRAAAKNHPFVLPLVDPRDYEWVLGELQAGRDIDLVARKRFAAKVFGHTAAYDQAVDAYFRAQAEKTAESAPFPERMSPRFVQLQALRYGENPHQGAAFYREASGVYGLAALEQRHGKALSYNNLLDLDSALAVTADLGAGSAVYIKHNNPCGAAQMETPQASVAAARACDPVSAFGAVVSVAGTVDKATAETLVETFLEAVVAPAYSDEALSILTTKKNLRVLTVPDVSPWRDRPGARILRQVCGGMLLQDEDISPTLAQEVEKGRVVTERKPTANEWEGLRFAWTVAKHVRSNAIVFAEAGRVLAVGAGQMSRVDSVHLCTRKAQGSLEGSVVASDAFFPFRDGVDGLAQAGARAIVQPGGSVRDEEVIAAANAYNVAMVFTGVRHFRH